MISNIFHKLTHSLNGPWTDLSTQAWQQASERDRSALLKGFRRFHVRLPPELLAAHADWCHTEGLEQEDLEIWEDLVQQQAEAVHIPWGLASALREKQAARGLWLRSVKPTGGCPEAWFVLQEWAQALQTGGSHAHELVTAMGEGLPLALEAGIELSQLRQTLLALFQCPSPKIDVGLGRLMDWFCQTEVFWSATEAPLSLDVLSSARQHLEEHHRDVAVERCWRQLIRCQTAVEISLGWAQ